MKAVAAVTEILLTILFSGIILIVFLLLPSLIIDTIKMLSLASSEVVARDIAGLLSVSGAATGDIEILYDPPGDVVYELTIDRGLVTVKTRGKSGPGWYIFQEEEGVAKTWVKIFVHYDEITEFKIIKLKTEKKDDYKVEKVR
ncbi:MAG: hypothetical protein QW609_02220 [Candidatus Aenigmatarchaeota archaeon]